MHKSVKNLAYIKNKIKEVVDYHPTIIAVSKTFGETDITPLLDFGHKHFGENKVQEGVNKWKNLKQKYKNIELHMIGKLQRNKVKECVKYFDFIHSVDNRKLAKKISEEQEKVKKRPKIFIQVNIGDESQKSGISKNNLEDLIIYCNEIKLDLVGLMCIPPVNSDPIKYFSEMNTLKRKFHLTELSMGMSSDYLQACKNSSSFLRIGSDIFGKRI